MPDIQSSQVTHNYNMLGLITMALWEHPFNTGGGWGDLIMEKISTPSNDHEKG